MGDVIGVCNELFNHKRGTHYSVQCEGPLYSKKKKKGAGGVAILRLPGCCRQ